MSQNNRTKQGHSFLFCLCDMRRAVIIVDIVGVILNNAIIAYTIITFDEPGEGEEIPRDIMLYGLWPRIAFLSAYGVCRLCGMFGALTFSILPILIALLMEIVHIIFCMLAKEWVGIPLCLIILYPHPFLCRELYSGIMTKENYKSDERQSCCCINQDKSGTIQDYGC
jgi:hypothetical protein